MVTTTIAMISASSHAARLVNDISIQVSPRILAYSDDKVESHPRRFPNSFATSAKGRVHWHESDDMGLMKVPFT